MLTLTLTRLSKTFDTGTVALRDVSLDVGRGVAVAVIGGSGSGKSTLLRLIAGLEQPTHGEVLLDGVPIVAPHRAVGLVFQEPRLLPWLTVDDNVGFGLDGVSARERVERVAAMLERVGLAGQGRRWPRELSGGMAQRAALARALVLDPAVLLLDEPFSALDAMIRAELQDHLAGLIERRRQSFVFVTHDIDEALVLADTVVVLRPRPGRIDAVVTVEPPRPRDRTGDAFAAARRELHAALKHSLDERRGFDPRYPRAQGDVAA